MAVDFFQNQCKTTSTKNQFGLCDNQENLQEKAYIDENNEDSWVGIVKNANNKEVSFFTIDNCIQLKRLDGQQDKKCDGLLLSNDDIKFVELKSRKGGKWLRDARYQLTSTYKHFRESHNIQKFTSIEAYVCNQLRPHVNLGHVVQIQKFKDDTGLVLRIQQSINI